MYSTLQAAVSDVAETCDRETRFLVLKKILEETELALINNSMKGGVISYQINTGQTIINVKQSSIAELTKAYKNLKALYNELCGIESGTNIMVMRDASSNMATMRALESDA